MRSFIAALLTLSLVVLSSSFASGMVYLNVTTKNYSVYYPLDAVVRIFHDENITSGSKLVVYIDGKKEAAKALDYMVQNQSYEPKTHAFSYNLTASGTIEWEEHPVQTFSYRIVAYGFCGGSSSPSQVCVEYSTQPGLCDSANGCPYEIQSQLYESSVSASDGLLFIKDATSLISPPPDAITTKWSVDILGNSDVEGTMRPACGGESYMGTPLDRNGWYGSLGRIINKSRCTQAGTGATCLVDPFDEESVSKGYSRYGGPLGGPNGEVNSGGVYIVGRENGEYIYQSIGGDALNDEISSVDGKNGIINFRYFDFDNTYVIFALPPNGSEHESSTHFCAYTSKSVHKENQWSSSGGETHASIKFGEKYTRKLSTDDFESLAPACPSGDICNITLLNMGVEKTSDPDGVVSLSFDAQGMAVEAVVTELIFNSFMEDEVNLADMNIPLSYLDPNESHVLRVELLGPSGVVLNFTESGFRVCKDRDKDGYCEESGTCSDLDPEQHPGKQELCNGRDDDCDGEIDEDFKDRENRISGKIPGILGEGCFSFTNSKGWKNACSGTWVCSKDGLNVTCSSGVYPGELKEICGNHIDDDCDGDWDENYPGDECVKEPPPGKFCRNGDNRPCGPGNRTGICRQGYSVCVNGTWGECKNAVYPREEVCNGKDDDCDGVVDNIGGGESVEETGCACYNGAGASSEVCNEIDDDCNGKIDDGISCCSSGDTRYCGTDVGVCRKGVQRCVEGRWSECKGGIEPVKEICYDKLDNDCDGQADEEDECNPSITCSNGMLDLNENGIDCGPECPVSCEPDITGWVLISFGVLFLLSAFVLLRIKGVVK